MVESHLSPKLRFSQFKTPWRKSTIGNHFKSLRTGMTPSRTNKSYFIGEIPWISSGELNYYYIDKTRERISEEAVENTNLRVYQPGTFFMAITGLEAPGTRGKCAINLLPATTNQSCLAFEKVTEIDNRFLLYWYLKHGVAFYYGYAQGTKQQSFNNQIVENFIIHLPLFSEQHKIANFFSTVDNRIQQLNKKKALLEQYKKGVMQQIFNQKIRFKQEDGNDYPDWEEKLLGEVVTFHSTNSHSRSLLNYSEGTVKNIHYGDIHTKFKSNFNIVNENVPFINPEINLSKIPAESYCKKGDLVIADASEDYKDIGKAIEIINLDNQTLVAGLHTYIARDISREMAVGFKGYLFQTARIRNQIQKMATGISVLGISKTNLVKIDLAVPCFEEQEKIANFLTAIDRKIELVGRQLNKTQEFKKGLLQQMFV